MSLPVVVAVPCNADGTADADDDVVDAAADGALNEVQEQERACSKGGGIHTDEAPEPVARWRKFWAHCRVHTAQ